SPSRMGVTDGAAFGLIVMMALFPSVSGAGDGEFIHRCRFSRDGDLYDQFLFRGGDVTSETGTSRRCHWDDVASCDDYFSFTFSIGKRNGVLAGRWVGSNYLEFG